MAQTTVGFVGVGRMGGPLTTRLLDAGQRVVVFDTSESAVAAAVQRGAVSAPSAAAVADAARVVFLSLPGPEIVHSVALGRLGLSTGTTLQRVVDFSTIGPRTAGQVARGLAERGIVYVDAPVSGGIAGATQGSLAVMVACARAVFEELESLLQLFGKVFHLGETAGQAQTMKLANNLLSAAAVAVSSEALVMGVKAGLDPALMLEVINAGSGRNSATQDKFPRAILPGTFDFGFATGLSYKDVRLCIDEAEALGVPMVVGAAVRQMLAVTNAVYGPDSDFTSVCRVVETWAGVTVRS
ncbi:MAG: NAD(P)-dependent oxidoreductase [Gammaproteobacteria bacterium]|nr:NAD(P)-dependent oxidoreductase [Gammaproteobacteria bacterium]